MLHERPASSSSPDGALAGALILACGLLSIVVVSHHPTVHTSSPAQLFQQVAAVGTMDELVHGTLIAFMLVLAFGFSVFALRQGMHRQTSVAGLTCYLAGAAALATAALIDGFFMPMFASANGNASGAAVSAALGVLAGGAAMIQIFTKVGFATLSLGILIWAAGLAGARGVVRFAAVAGLIAGVVPIGIMAFGQHPLNPMTVTLILLSQAGWNVAVGVLMARRIL